MSDEEKWTVPPDLAQYDQYTNHPGRAEELVNNPVSMFANHVVGIMRAEVAAQYRLLAQLHKAGLLRASGRTVRLHKVRNHNLVIEEDPIDSEVFEGLTDDQVGILQRAADDSVWYDVEEIKGEAP